MSNSLPPSQQDQLNKVAIVGCGRVGMSAAFSLLHRGDVNELVLFGRSKKDLEGEKLDLEHGLSFLSPATITAADDPLALVNTDVIVFAAGASQQPGETRLDLLKKNSSIIQKMIPDLVKAAPEAVILMVTNPVDILTYQAYQIADLPKGRVFGSGTVLDTARFRFHLSQFLHVNPRSIHTYILGEHGDASFPVISSATVGGQPLAEFPDFSQEQVQKAYEAARSAAYTIIQSKGATYYGIGVVISHLVSTILKNSRSVLPVSIPLHNYLGFSGVALSVPCIVGRTGVEAILKPRLDWEEKQMLEKSVNVLKKYG